MSTSRRNDEMRRGRQKVQNQARALARSGPHATCESIISVLEPVERFVTVHLCLKGRLFRAQIDRLGLVAQERRPSQNRAAGSPRHSTNAVP
jgi:hypothetical protein